MSNLVVRPDPIFKITFYTHFFKLTNITPRGLNLIYTLCNKYVMMEYVREPGFRKPVLKPVRVFASRTINNQEFRFHIGQFPEFKEILNKNHVDEGMYATEIIPLYEPDKVNFTFNEKYQLRDYQIEGKDFVIREESTDNHSRLVTLGTGRGKTVLTAAALAELNTRVFIQILPQYIDKWAKDVQNLLGVKPKEIMVVQGSAQLRGLSFLAKEGKIDNIKVIIVSVVTMRNYFKLYEKSNGDVSIEGYECNPEDLFRLLKIGSIVIDEAHQHLYAFYKAMLYMHVLKVIALSATYITEHPLLEKVQKAMFPREIRFKDPEVKKYINCFAFSYYINDFQKYKIKTKTFGSSSYSHNEFEKSILKNKVLTERYLKLLDYLIKFGYESDYKKGDKLAVFAGTVAMCTLLTDHLAARFPHLSVKRFVEVDPYSNLIDSDIRVTTILSGGTAHDIPNLRTVIMMNSISSPVPNLQTLGRLRELSDRDVKFIYMYCNDVPKQVAYHQAKKELFKDKVAGIKEYQSPVNL